MTSHTKKLSAVALCAATLTGCATQQEAPLYTGTAVGGAAGGIIGGLLGSALGGKTGAALGAAAGLAAGGAVGNYMDRQRQALHQAVAEANAANQANIQLRQMQDGSLKLDFPSEVFFDLNSAALKPSFESTLAQVAKILSEYNQSTIQIDGYTDSTGSLPYNMRLSKERAESVGGFLVEHGVAPQRILAQGMGPADPKASNATAAGRQLNRRVEMLIRPPAQQAMAEPQSQPQQGGYY